MSVKPSKAIVGVSSCLLGEKVRYDGGHQAQPVLVKWLEAHVHVQSFCPEVSAGFGVPRPAIQLLMVNGEVRCVRVEDLNDMTEQLMTGFNWQQFKDLSGFVLKSRSPSCGLGEVKLSGALGQYRNGQGLFAQWLRQRFPAMPLASEQQLQSARQRQQFLQAVQAYAEEN